MSTFSSALNTAHDSRWSYKPVRWLIDPKSAIAWTQCVPPAFSLPTDFYPQTFAPNTFQRSTRESTSGTRKRRMRTEQDRTSLTEAREGYEKRRRFISSDPSVTLTAHDESSPYRSPEYGLPVLQSPAALDGESPVFSNDSARESTQTASSNDERRRENVSESGRLNDR